MSWKEGAVIESPIEGSAVGVMFPMGENGSMLILKW